MTASNRPTKQGAGARDNKRESVGVGGHNPEFVREGYRWRLDADASKYRPQRVNAEKVTFSVTDTLNDYYDGGIEWLKGERIFDWKSWVDRKGELGPVASAMVRLLESIEALTIIDRLRPDDRDAMIAAAMSVGGSLEHLMAQIEWEKRNPPASANAVRQSRVSRRRASLAEYIQTNGRRPATRPGSWYAAFRETFPSDAASDKTLKADYPHALALLRRRI